MNTRKPLCLVVQSCPTLCVTSWTLAHQALLSMGFSRQEYWSGLPCASPRDLPNTGIEPRSPALQVDSLPAELPGKPWKPLHGVTRKGKGTSLASRSCPVYILRRKCPRILCYLPWESPACSRFSRVWLFATLWTIAHRAPLSTGVPRQEYWSR